MFAILQLLKLQIIVRIFIFNYYYMNILFSNAFRYFEFCHSNAKWVFDRALRGDGQLGGRK